MLYWWRWAFSDSRPLPRVACEHWSGGCFHAEAVVLVVVDGEAVAGGHDDDGNVHDHDEDGDVAVALMVMVLIIFDLRSFRQWCYSGWPTRNFRNKIGFATYHLLLWPTMPSNTLSNIKNNIKCMHKQNLSLTWKNLAGDHIFEYILIFVFASLCSITNAKVGSRKNTAGQLGNTNIAYLGFLSTSRNRNNISLHFFLASSSNSNELPLCMLGQHIEVEVGLVH